jgi:predicted nucleic acid-binding protein
LGFVLVDAGPLIALGKLNRLHLLAELYEVIHIPRAVYHETVIEGAVRDAPDSLNIRLFLDHYQFPILDVSEEIVRYQQQWSHLGSGEKHLLSLALSFTGTEVQVLVDDESAREEARRLGLFVKGTVGILVQAYRAKLLTLDDIELLLLEIAARPDIWISEKLCRQVIEQLKRDP